MRKTVDPTTRGDEPVELPPGTVVAGKFVLGDPIGRGGMGQVYSAEQKPMGRPVALKLMRPHLADDPDAEQRFFREALALSKLQHPHITTLIDYGKTAKGRLFLVMEYHEGDRLDRLMNEHQRLPLDRAVHIVTQVGLALGAAHERGIVHRDLKPENILLTEVNGQPDFVKLIDFGVAFHDPAEGLVRITRAGLTCGTPEYMSPEQVEGGEVTARTDMYGVGLLLFEMLEGRRPFSGPTAPAVMRAHLSAPPPDLSPDIPASMNALVQRLLAKDAADRPADADELMRCLEQAVPPGVSLYPRGSGGYSRATVPHAAAIPLSEEAQRVRDLPNPPMTPARVRSRPGPRPSTPVPQAENTEQQSHWMLWSGVLLLLIAPLFLWLSSGDDGEGGSASDGTRALAPATDDSGEQGSGSAAENLATPGGEVLAGDDLADEIRPDGTITTVMLASRPADASAYVDNRYIGLTPVRTELPSGQPVEIRLLLEGYDEFRQQVTATHALAGKTLGPYLLEPTAADRQAESEQSGARRDPVSDDEDEDPDDDRDESERDRDDGDDPALERERPERRRRPPPHSRGRRRDH